MSAMSHRIETERGRGMPEEKEGNAWAYSYTQLSQDNQTNQYTTEKKKLQQFFLEETFHLHIIF